LFPFKKYATLFRRETMSVIQSGMRSGDDLANVRTDVIGSLLRPAAVREARVAFDGGGLSAEALRAIEDDAVRDAVRLQEDLGLVS
jgi:hypothetical protein